MSNFEVKVPATIANLGPGFDCLGLAINIWNSVILKVGQERVVINGFGEDSLPKDESNLIHVSISKVFQKLQLPTPKLTNESHKFLNPAYKHDEDMGWWYGNTIKYTENMGWWYDHVITCKKCL